MLKRKAYEKLLEWKQQQAGKTAVLIEGARRVGKSTLAKEFGLNEYKSCLVIDFFQAPDEVKQYFRDYSNDFDALFLYLSAYYSVELFDRESLVVFDEVQMFPFARGLVKYLVTDGRYDYVETGSLLSIKQNIQDIVVPSEEQTLELAPFDFEEFLWAMGEKPLAQFIGSSFDSLKPLPDNLHRKASALFREYMLVGGMPEPVRIYTEQRKFQPVEQAKRQIIELYRNDVARFARGYEFKVVSVLDGIPGQLSKHEKKFTLSSISKNARMRTYEEAFFWLSDARIANICYASTDPSVGLGLSVEQTPRSAIWQTRGCSRRLHCRRERRTKRACTGRCSGATWASTRGCLSKTWSRNALSPMGASCFSIRSRGRKKTSSAWKSISLSYDRT